jgi:hypothetical protein
MHPTRPLLALIALLASAFGHAGTLGDVEIFDRTTGQTLPLHEHGGRLYVAGEPRHQYELRIRNSSSGRVLAVTSVDGINVITGQTAAEQQSGYVLGAWDSVRVEGWRKSMEQVATFYFTSLADSYAARTGRPHDVGVIGVALFREYRPRYQPCCSDLRKERPAAASAPESSADAAELERDSTAQRRSESKLGTSHGHREASPAQYVEFQRASATPDETIVIYYDSRKNLVAQGVLPQPQRPWFANRRPQPFPNGFVPDP